MGNHRGILRGRRGWAVLGAPLLVLVGAVVVVGPRVFGWQGVPWAGTAATGGCTETSITVVVTPELADPVTEVLRPVQGRRLRDGHCLKADVLAEEPAETVAASRGASVARAPQVWIPDSSLWARQVIDWQLQAEESFAWSPLVIATSSATAGRLGWTMEPPTWAAAMRGSRPLAMTDLQRSATGQLSVMTLWQSLGGGDAAAKAVVTAALAFTRGSAPAPGAVIAAAVKNDPATPLLVTSEAEVFMVNRGTSLSELVAVYPADGSPTLDYPVLRLERTQQRPEQAIAVDAVLVALESDLTHEVVRRYGLRDTAGGGPGGTGVATGKVATIPLPGDAATAEFLQRLQSQLVPSRILTVIDVSGSMRSQVQPGLTRLQLAGRAAAAAGNLMSDRSSVGLWVFSRNIDGGDGEEVNWRQLAAVAPLGTVDRGRSQRAVVIQQLAGLETHLGGDGTALYATTLAAMREAVKSYDRNSINSVVIFTDGSNDDNGGMTLPQLLTDLKALVDPARPVRLIAIGIGPNTDLDVLRQLVGPTRGAAYQADSPEYLQTVLLNELARRSD